jgi:putative ABC transport system permease protein
MQLDFDRPPAWRRYLRFWGAEPAADVDEELRFHIEARVAELMEAGASEQEARQAAQLRFGDLTAIRERCKALSEEAERSRRRARWHTDMRQDVQYGIRQLTRNRVFTIIAAFTIALGIGANSAIFSVLDAVLLRPLPFADADRLTSINERWRGEHMQSAVGQYVDWQQQNRSFEEIGATHGGSVVLTGRGDPERLHAAFATASYFRTLRLPTIIGRYFTDAEDRLGTGRVVVLSEGLWRRRFGADSGIVGRALLLDGQPYLVIGVAPKTFELTSEAPQLYIPAAFTPQQIAGRDNHYLNVVGLLRIGISAAAAEQELSEIQRRTLRQNAGIGADSTVGVRSLHDVLVREYRTQLIVLQAAVVLVLLIACVNLANLLLARSTTRRREMAIRTALGAGRVRLVRQLLTESVLLAALGCIGGLLIAHFGIRFLIAFTPESVPRLRDAGLSLHVLAFTILTSVVCGVVFGLVPALRASRSTLQTMLRAGGKGSTLGGARDRLRAVLVSAEVAIALVLLVGAGLLIRSAVLMQRVHPGFDVEGLVTFSVSLPTTRYPAVSQIEQTFARIQATLTQLPSVRAGALVSSTPFMGASTNGIDLERGNVPDALGTVTLRMTSPGYLQAMRIPLRAGRFFNEDDDATAAKVTIINETMARLAFPGENPIGQRIGCCEGERSEERRWKTVVGVVADLRSWGLNQGVRPEFYLPLEQAPPGGWDWIQRTVTVVLRTTAAPALVSRAAQRSIRAIDRELPIQHVRTMEQMIGESTAPTRFNMLLLLLLGLVGLCLATVGIYGVINYLVGQRTQEFGLRVALGATARDVQLMVLREGLALAGAGIVVGLTAALLLARSISGLLFSTDPRDPLTFGSIALLLGLVAVLASWLPARRATRVAPMTALHSL